MRSIPLHGSMRLQRVPHPEAGWGDNRNGIGYFTLKSGAVMNVIFSDGEGWDHVSASLPDRCPTWEEMCEVKKFFFEDSEWVVQFHPATIEYVNCHPFCLHLWRSQWQAQPTPPRYLVGP